MSVYEKKSLLDNRYQILASSSIYTYDDDNLTSYAEFLRKFGRYISKEGFVDASSTINRFKLKQNDTDSLKSSRSKSYPDKLKPENKSTDIIKNTVERQKQHEKHLKLIEDQMIQSKQEERGVKRQEGEVKKDQRTIRHAIRELDTIVSRKRLEADKNLTKNLSEKTRLEIDNAHRKEETTKRRTEKNLEVLQHSKDKGRKNLLVCNDLARQYKLKMNELDIKHHELNRIQNDFEEKIRSKEEDEARIKREIAEIALALNMETKKVKDELFDFRRSIEKDKEKQVKIDLDTQANLEQKISQTSNYIKNYDLNRRRLSHDAVNDKSSWSVKQREATRRIVDTRNNLENIYQRQKRLNEVFQTAEMDRKANEIIQKIEDVSTRKQHMQTYAQNERREQNEKSENTFSERAFTKLIEKDIKQQEDNLKHLQKIAQKDDEQQSELYKTVKDSEFQRRKQEKELQKLQDEYILKQKENSTIIKEMLAKVFYEEQSMQQRISKEKAKLDKYHSEREETYSRLLSHKEKTKEDKFLLNHYSKTYSRLLNCKEKSKEEKFVLENYSY